MHKTTLAALAALTLVAAVAAASARPNAGVAPRFSLNMHDVRTALDPDRIKSALPNAIAEVRHKSNKAFQSVSSARHVNVPVPRAASAIARTTAALRSIKPTLVPKDSLGSKVVATLRNKLKPSSIFKSKAEVQEMRALNKASRRTEHEMGSCTGLEDLDDPPTNDQMMEVCDNDCCFYRDTLAWNFELALSDIDTLFCAKDGEDYCLANVPDFIFDDGEPTNEQLANVCDSSCKENWIGLAVVDGLTSRRAQHEAGADWTGLANMMCLKNGADYCLTTIGDLEDFEDPPTQDNLEVLCGPCADFYFGVFEITGEDMANARSQLCAKDADENFCLLNMPTFVDEENPTNDEVATVCESPCKVPWLISLTDDDESVGDTMRRAAPVMDPFEEMADKFCLKEADTDQYCILSMGDLENFEANVGNLTMMCDAGACTDFYMYALGMEMGISPEDAKTLLCTKDGNDFCLLTADAAVGGLVNTESPPASAVWDTLCGSPCAEVWMYAGFIMDDNENMPSEDRRRLLQQQGGGGGASGGGMGGPAPPGPPKRTLAQLKNIMCSKGESGQYCIYEMAEMGEDAARRDEHETPGMFGPEYLDQICNPGTCMAQMLDIATLMGGGMGDGGMGFEEMTGFLCAKKANGNYCIADMMDAFAKMAEANQGNQGQGNQGQGQGNEGPPIPPAILDLLCGECLAQVGGDGAAGLLGLLLMGSGMGGEAHEAGFQQIVDLMCLKNDEDYCMVDKDVQEFLGDGEGFMEQLTDPATNPGQRKQSAKKLCENSCINSFTSLALEMTSSGIEECMDGQTLFAYKTVVNGCTKKGEAEYCIETYYNELASGIAMNEACGISEDFEWVATCSADCKTAVTTLAEKWGCCGRALDFPIVGEVETSCSVAFPSECAKSGKIMMGIDVGNLKNSWLSGKLSDRAIAAAIRKDVGAALNVPSGLIDVTGSKAKGNGATIECEVEVLSKELGKAMLRKIKGGKGARRADGPAVSFASLAAAIPEEDRAAAMVNPSAALTGAVDTESLATEGEEMAAIESEVNVELGIEEAPSASPRLAAAAWLTLTAVLAALATVF